ncbi:MAG: shikimate kinase [Clostridiales bacterium]|jgi:shikimate kinase|nr:shikimate kinase [Clostridiales bacterium]
MNIVLIGMPGSSKSTSGRRAAAMLGFRFADTDAVVERRAKMTIPEIFAKGGEALFRELETEAAITVSGYTDAVIATGGGIVVKRDNMAVLNKNAVTVYLSATPEALFKRIKDSRNRPLLRGAMSVETLAAMLEVRGSLYKKYSRRTVDTTGLTAEQTAAKIVDTYIAENSK